MISALTLGLGADTVVKSIEIHWPSGIVQRLNDVRADQILKGRRAGGNTREALLKYVLGDLFFGREIVVFCWGFWGNEVGNVVFLW